MRRLAMDAHDEGLAGFLQNVAQLAYVVDADVDADDVIVLAKRPSTGQSIPRGCLPGLLDRGRSS